MRLDDHSMQIVLRKGHRTNSRAGMFRRIWCVGGRPLCGSFLIPEHLSQYYTHMNTTNYNILEKYTTHIVHTHTAKPNKMKMNMQMERCGVLEHGQMYGTTFTVLCNVTAEQRSTFGCISFAFSTAILAYMSYGTIVQFM